MHVIDILLVAYLIYRVLLLIRGTRAWRIAMGVAVFVGLLIFSNYAQLTTLHWVLDKATLLAPVALVILLLPELRQALEGVGRLGPRIGKTEQRMEAQTVEEVIAAVTEMAASSVGALVVIEKGAPMDEIVSNGVLLEARVSAALLGSVFYEGNPLHDGAVIIRGDTIQAAACRLPLSESMRLDKTLHMRHRAAVGVTEQHDCLAIVVSEERGVISLCADGRLTRIASPGELRDILNTELRGVGEHRESAIRRRLRRIREEAKR